jgi:hypothetical protein
LIADPAVSNGNAFRSETLIIRNICGNSAIVRRPLWIICGSDILEG